MTRSRLTAGLVAAVLGLAPVASTRGADEARPPLRPRATFAKDAVPDVDPKTHALGLLVLKLAEGTHVRLRQGRLSAEGAKRSEAEQILMSDAGLTEPLLAEDLAAIAGLAADGAVSIERLFSGASEEELAAGKARGEARSGDALADLDLYFALRPASPTPREAARLLSALNALPSVETAYAQLLPAVPRADLAPPTPSMVSNQRYLEPSSTVNGIDAWYAWGFPGGRGAGGQIVDVERGWHLMHEDMPPTYYSSGWFWDSFEHGTAVVGIVAAENNGFGMTGIASDADVGVHTPVPFYNLPEAIRAAGEKLAGGDVLLIEQQFFGPAVPGGPGCAGEQWAMVPVEWEQAEFDAISNLKGRGVIVVEAAGNGAQDLDHPRYLGRFDRGVRDSGAIIVGAGDPADRATLCFSNAGSRVDVQGWGDMIATLSGDSELGMPPGDVLQAYTNTFGGTSGASPIVSGAILSIQGMLRARGQDLLGPADMRRFVRAIGRRQDDAESRPIGPLPDLRRAADALGDTARAAFLHLSSADNVSGNVTYLDHPALNQNPAAILNVTHVFNPPNGSGRYLDKPFGVYYDTGRMRWGIFLQDGSYMPAGLGFHVAEAPGFVKVVDTADGSVIDHPLLDSVDALDVQVTQNWNPRHVYNNHPVGVRFDPDLRRWRIVSGDGAPLPLGAAFNVTFTRFTQAAFTPRVTALNSSWHTLRLDHPMLDGHPEALLSVTGPDAPQLGVWYDGSKWWIYNEDTSRPMRQGDVYRVNVRKRVLTSTVRLQESGGWISRGLSLLAGDRVRVECHGLVHPGLALDPSYGPMGTSDPASAAFPAPGINKFSAIGRVGSGAPFLVGDSTFVAAGAVGRLDLRVNDDVIGNGHGWFNCTTAIWR